MSPKTPPPGKEERLAKALRDNLARRKALQRTQRGRADAHEKSDPPAPPARSNDDEAS